MKKWATTNLPSAHCSNMCYNDTVFSARSDSTLAVVQTKYETEKKDHEIQLLSKDRELQSAVISRQRILRNALIAPAYKPGL